MHAGLNAADLSAADQTLVEHAAALARRYGGNGVTCAAAARTAGGGIISGLNVPHFTGGPCAELVVLGSAAAQGAALEAIVAVDDTGRGVVPPCGRCRQVLFDRLSSINVIIPVGTGLRTIPIRELLPTPYVPP